MPEVVDDFWQTYLDAGGTERGGCASGLAGPLALAALAGALALAGGGSEAPRRRGRPRRARHRRPRAESPRWGSFEIAAGPYRPDVDSDFAGAAALGDSLRHEPGLDVPRWAPRARSSPASGRSRWGCRPATSRGAGTGCSRAAPRSGDRTRFRMIPTSATLTYRFDWLAERYRIPLAPYGRVALERYNWWVTDGDGRPDEERRDERLVGRGRPRPAARLLRPDARARARRGHRREPHVPVLRGEADEGGRLRLEHELGPLRRPGRRCRAACCSCSERCGSRARASGASAPAARRGPARAAPG